MISVPRSTFENIFNMLGESLRGTSGPLKLTKSGKPRKESSNKGKPTSNGDFTKKILSEQKEAVATFKAANPEMKGSHLTFVSNYKKEHPGEYDAFKAEWILAHPNSETDSTKESPEDSVSVEGSTEAPVEKPKRVMSDEQKAKMKAGREAAAAAKKANKDTEKAVVEEGPREESVATPAATKPVKKAKKAITTDVVTPAPVSQVTELLPFAMGPDTYLRHGVQRPDGNHLWTSGHLWASDKGAKGKYIGEIADDGTVNKSAAEPKC